jgi:hypothetical protein
MRLGLLPSQQRALDQAFKKARKFDDFRGPTRRRFLALGVAACGASLATFFAGRASRDLIADPQPADSGHRPTIERDWLRGVVTGPIEELRAQAMHVTAALEGASADDVHWIGFHRLCGYARENPQDLVLRNRLASFKTSVSHAVEAAAALR